MSLKHDLRREEAYAQIRVYCKCGHSISLPMNQEKTVCSNCNKYVYREKEPNSYRNEFGDRLNSALLKQKRKDLSKGE